MTLTEKINADYMVAFKAKDQVAKLLLSTIKGAIQTEDKNNSGSGVSDDDVIKLLTKFEKSLKSVYDNSPTSEAERELSIVKAYLPEQMGENEMEAKVDELISNGANNIGMIMKGFAGLTVDRLLLSRIAKNKLEG